MFERQASAQLALIIGTVVWLGHGCRGSDEAGNPDGATTGSTTQTPTENSGTVMENPCAPSASGLVTFSTPSGTFESSVSVELQATDPAAEIRYTIDHTPPNADSPLYAAPLLFNETTELRVQAFEGGEGGEPVGPPQAAVYIARSFDKHHDLPVLVLDSYGQAVPGAEPDLVPSDEPFSREYMSAAVMSFEPNAGVTSFAAPPVVASGVGVHVRGQSSAFFAKKPYRIEIRDATDADRDCPMFGMPSESDWVLTPSFADKALIRNAFAYSLGPDMGVAAPRGRLVEVYINSEPRALQSSDYQGVYHFTENIKNQKQRLNLQQLEPSDTMLPDIQGGYIFKFEWGQEDIEQPLACPQGAEHCWDWLGVADPKPWNQEQQTYLASHLAELAAAFHASTPADPTLGYPAFIDTDSFVNHVIINELTRNMDSYMRSQYFYKDRDSKVFAGPLWDFDLIAGVGSSLGRYANTSLEGWQYANFESRWETADWFQVLVNDPPFQGALTARWRELRQGVLSNAEIVVRIQRLSQGLASAAQRNFEKWPILTTEDIEQFETPTADTWQGQVEVMQEWLLGRAAWLDTQW